MMKKFEEYLKERIKELMQFVETDKAIINSDVSENIKTNMVIASIKRQARIEELEMTLNHFMQSVEVQSVADNECENKDLLNDGCKNKGTHGIWSGPGTSA